LGRLPKNGRALPVHRAPALQITSDLPIRSGLQLAASFNDQATAMARAALVLGLLLLAAVAVAPFAAEAKKKKAAEPPAEAPSADAPAADAPADGPGGPAPGPAEGIDGLSDSSDDN
jgi:hypothetical protein